MRQLVALLLGAWLLTLPALGSAAAVDLAAFPPTGRLDYTVLREGSKIGTQSVEFRRDGDKLTVHTRADIELSLLGIVLYRFEHDAEEQWMNGRLVQFGSRTNDDGKDRQVALHREDGRLRGLYNGTAVDLPPLIPASLWHPDTVNQSILLDPIKGRERQVQVADKGAEKIVVKGKPVTTRHYSMTGQIKREFWYGPDRQLVQVRFPAKDGSEITVVLR